MRLMMCLEEKVSIFTRRIYCLNTVPRQRRLHIHTHVAGETIEREKKSLNSRKEKACGKTTADLASFGPNGRHTSLLMVRLLAGPRPNSCLDWQKVINCKTIYIYIKATPEYYFPNVTLSFTTDLSGFSRHHRPATVFSYSQPYVPYKV